MTGEKETEHIFAEANLLTGGELAQLAGLYRELLRNTRDVAEPDDAAKLRDIMQKGAREGFYARDKFGNSSFIRSLLTANALCTRISPDRNMVIAVLLYPLCLSSYLTAEAVGKEWGDDIAKMVRGLLKAIALYQRGAAVESENFRRLLMAFAEDIRVIIIMIVDRLTLMKAQIHRPGDLHLNRTAAKRTQECERCIYRGVHSPCKSETRKHGADV